MALSFSHTCARDGTRIWYSREPGIGAPLLFVLHSFLPPASVLADSSGSLKLHRGLAHGASWYMFDWRGSGRSSNGAGPITFESMADDLEAVADAIGGPFDLNAINDGCGIALAFAARRPAVVRRMLLIAPQGEIARSPRFVERARRNKGADAITALAGMMMWIHPGTDSVESFAVAEKSLRVKPLPLVEELRRAAMSVDTLSFAPAVTTPTLVLVSGDEAQDGFDLAAAMSNARAIRWTDIGDGTINGANWRKAWDELSPPRSEVDGSSAVVSSNTTHLSSRELQVLHLVVQGHSSRRIAEELVISEPTVATHIRHILEKSGTANRTEAAAIYSASLTEQPGVASP